MKDRCGCMGQDMNCPHCHGTGWVGFPTDSHPFPRIIEEQKDGFWVRLWMESGRGNPKIDQTYVYYKYIDGYTEKDGFSADAYDWAGYDMGGFEMMRFTSGFEIIMKPPTCWLKKRLKEIEDEKKNINEEETRIKKELGAN